MSRYMADHLRDIFAVRGVKPASPNYSPDELMQYWIDDTLWVRALWASTMRMEKRHGLGA